MDITSYLQWKAQRLRLKKCQKRRFAPELLPQQARKSFNISPTFFCNFLISQFIRSFRKARLLGDTQNKPGELQWLSHLQTTQDGRLQDPQRELRLRSHRRQHLRNHRRHSDSTCTPPFTSPPPPSHNYPALTSPKVAYLLWCQLQSHHTLFRHYTIPEFLADFLLHVGLLLSAITLYADVSLYLHIWLFGIGVFIWGFPSNPAPPLKFPIHPKMSEKPDLLPIRPFVTAYRGGMIIITCLAILAVDFPVFPRRFAKVETWGTSLMDLGVGSFVFSAGLVSARPIIKGQLAGEKTSIVRQLKAAVRSCTPLFILGFVRLYVVKKVDYAEHVSEYGVHWNFFFTLGLLPPFVAVFQLIPPLLRYEIIPHLMIIGYQCILYYSRLTAFILTAPRVDLITQNREGIFSFVGYLTIFLVGQGFGMEILPRHPPGTSPDDPPNDTREHMMNSMTRLSLGWAAQYIISTFPVCGLCLDVSRRLANEPYVVWVIVFNGFQLVAYVHIESYMFPSVSMTKDKFMEEKSIKKSTPRLLHAFNRNGLFIFLLANILTGLVNLSFDTIHMGDYWAVAILGAYALILSAVAVQLDRWDISIKL